jgi:hypothetical protein
MKKLWTLSIIFLINGCTGKTVLLKNNKGELAKCEVSATDTMHTGIIGRNWTIDNCIKEYESAGYHRVTKEE